MNLLEQYLELLKSCENTKAREYIIHTSSALDKAFHDLFLKQIKHNKYEQRNSTTDGSK